MNILITRPEHDDTTHYLSSWSKEIIDFAEIKGFKVIDLTRSKATRAEVESRLKKSPIKLIIFNGHGSEEAVSGHKNEPLIIANKNEDLLNEKIIYAISCKSAKILGPASILKGALSYMGYDDDFIFIYEPEKLSKPLTDETAELFLKPSQRLIESLIKGNSVENATEKTKNLMKENIIKSLSGNSSVTRYLWWNLKHFSSCGNLKSSLES